MAANFQPHMGGPGQVMPQRPQQQRQPQNGAPNATTQIQQVIYQTVNSQTGHLTGWQSNVLVQERIGLIFSIIGNLRLASQNTQAPPGLNKMIEIGIKFEKEIFHSSPDKNSYKRAVEDKLAQLLERRHQNQAGMQQTINQQAQAQAQAQQQQAQQQQQMMMNQNGMSGQGPRAMPQQPAQQGFQHLQHQMQASPLPGQQPQQMPIGMTNDGLPPNMTPNQQQQPFQIPMQQSQQPQPNGPPMTPQENAILIEMAGRLMNQASLEEKNQVRAGLTKRLDPQTLNGYVQRGQDPVIAFYRNQALNQLRENKRRQMQQQMAISQQGQNLSNGAPPMQHQRSMNPSPLNGQTQPPTSMGGNADFGGFLGNMDNIANQQQQGINAQESGQVVVPANSAPRNATPQPGGMPGQQMGHPNSRTAQQHHLLMRQQRMQAAQQQQQQQQQSQTQARMNAQSKAAQIGLQGQPGGMGNGPMPPQQSPAMATLNAPLRTPSQMGQTEPPQANPNPAFGQPLDPRFAQGNPRAVPGGAMNAAGMNPAMFNSLTQQQRQDIVGVPPDKLNEVMNKWNEQRQINAANVPGRPPVPMPGNNQAQPGQQIPQPGPFNPLNQFNMNAQRPQQGQMAPGANQQQTMLIQQQIARMQQNSAMQRGNVPPMGMPNEQRMIAQMDNVDFPPNLLNHQNMPRGIPAEIKKWGSLKAWAQQNPNIGPDLQENIIKLQKLHCSSIMRTRAAQTGQHGGMQPGAPGGQSIMPPIPAGMNAPVAPMGQPPMQLPNGMNMPGQHQITPAEINAVRNHHSGKMLQATDDQIRTFIIRQQGRQQQVANMQFQNQQMQNHMSQINGQPPRPGQPPQNFNGRGPNQPPPAQVPAPKPPTAPELPVSNANRASRPQPTNARSAGPSSSPAQPANKLKRASSDDVVEISNPNGQQPARPTPQPPPVQKRPSQQGRLPQAQVAALDPEARKKYEMGLKMERFKTIMQEEMQPKPAADIHMDQETKANVLNKLRGIIQPLQNMSRAVLRWYQVTQDEARVRQFCRLKTRVRQQFRDDAMAQPREMFSIGLKELDQGMTMLSSMVEDLSKKYPGMRKAQPQQSAQTQAAPTSKPPAQASQPVPVQLSAANLQQQQQQLNQQQQMNKMHQRSNSRGSHAPAAPTSSQLPYQFGAGSPTAAGVPTYATKQPPVTRETLQIPAKKRQKQETRPGIGQNAPGANASPSATKAVSPEVKRQAVEPKQPPKPSFTCSELDCERHNVGFESAEALQAHNQQEHTIENPMQFAMQNLGSVLNLDAQGHAKVPPVSHDATAGHNAAKMSISGSKQGQTPNMKSENTPSAATPMNRQVSMNRQSSAAGTRQGPQSKATPSKEVAKTPASQKDTSKQRPIQPPKETVVEDPWANATIDPHDLFQAFQPFETGAGGAISDMNVYRSITPNDTPESSKDGVSEPNSDISDGVGLDISLDIFDKKWMPFGPSEADTFLDMNNFNVGQDSGKIGDLTMFDEEQPALNFGSWDDMVDTSAFDKPFTFDPSLYSMNAD